VPAIYEQQGQYSVTVTILKLQIIIVLRLVRFEIENTTEKMYIYVLKNPETNAYTNQPAPWSRVLQLTKKFPAFNGP
jgi:hypothetical protein